MKEFEFSYFDDIGDALIEVTEQSRKNFPYCSMMRKSAWSTGGVFTKEIFHSPKSDKNSLTAPRIFIAVFHNFLKIFSTVNRFRCFWIEFLSPQDYICGERNIRGLWISLLLESMEFRPIWCPMCVVLIRSHILYGSNRLHCIAFWPSLFRLFSTDWVAILFLFSKSPALIRFQYYPYRLMPGCIPVHWRSLTEKLLL